jgi:hypothetical protein
MFAMSSSKPAGQGASEPWSKGEMAALVDKWDQLYQQRKRPLSAIEWRDVCAVVNAHRAAAGYRFDRTIAECQERLYDLKPNYKEVEKGQAFFAGPNHRPTSGSCFAAKMPPASVKGKGEASGSAGGRTVPMKRHFSLDVVPLVDEEEEEVGGEEPAHGAASVDCSPGAVVIKLAEVYWSVEMERHGAASMDCSPGAVVMKLAEVYGSVKKKKMAMENLGETDSKNN